MNCPRCGLPVPGGPAGTGRPRAAAIGAALLALGSLLLLGMAIVFARTLPTVAADGWFSPLWPKIASGVLAATAVLLLAGAWQLLGRRFQFRCRQCGFQGALPSAAP